MRLKNLENRIEKMEKVRGINKPTVFIVVKFVGSDREGNQDVLTPEEEAVLEKYKAETIAAAKPGQRFVAVYWTKDKAQELLAQASKGQNPEN